MPAHQAAHVPATAGRLEGALAAAKAPATRRAYRTAWTAWTSWAGAHGAAAIPAAPAAVAAIRRALNGRADTLPGASTMALVSVLSDTGLRRSEAAALTWADIERAEDGSGRLRINRSKTDQTGAGSVVAVTRQAMQDFDRLRELSMCALDASVVGLSDRQIARRIAAAAEAAGLGAGYSGHSGRVGMAQRMTRNGAPATAVMRQGRGKSTAMVARYTRNETAAEALRYL